MDWLEVLEFLCSFIGKMIMYDVFKDKGTPSTDSNLTPADKGVAGSSNTLDDKVEPTLGVLDDLTIEDLIFFFI